MFLIDPLALAAVVAVFVPLERLFALRPAQGVFRRGWRTDLLHFLLTGLVIRAGVAAVLLSALAVSPCVVPAALQESIAALPIWASFPLALVIADLGFYATHRAFHAIPALWRYHLVHHSIEEMDWLAAHRVHPVDQIVTKSASLLPVVLLGFSAEALAAFAVLYHWQSLLIHSNVRVDFGPLRWVLASPQFHHWHHANAPEALDKNFAGQLPFLDALFGTLHLPGRATPERYGVNKPMPENYLGQLAFPFAGRRRARPEDAQPAAARRLLNSIGP